MPLPRGLDLITDEVRALLAEGEVPHAYELATQLAAHSGIGGTAHPRPDLQLHLDPLAPGLSVDPGWIAATLGGVNAAGQVGSLADGFSRALGAGNGHILLTDRRLAVIATDAPLRGPITQRLAFEVDRRAIASVDRAPRLLQRGRLAITFVDGSWAMAMMGIVKAAAARRLVDALGRAHPPDRGGVGTEPRA